MRMGVLAAGAATALALTAPAWAANDPAAVWKAYEAIINRGDTEALRALIHEDAAPIKFPTCTATTSNRDCLVSYIDTTVIKRHGSIKALDVKVEGEVVRASIELRSDMAKRANVDRALGVDEIRTRDGKIVSLRFTPDPNDEQTKAYFGGRLPPQPGAAAAAANP